VVVASKTICILAGTITLMAEYSHSKLSLVAIGCFLIGLLWLLAEWRHWAWMASPAFFVLVGAAGIGAWMGLSPILMVFSVLGSLLAWDLDDFSRRLQSAAPEDDLRKLENKHLVHLIILGTTGLSLSLVAIYLHLQISFGWLFLLALAAVLGMMQLVKRLRREG
jgi:hypothetical protein